MICLNFLKTWLGITLRFILIELILNRFDTKRRWLFVAWAEMSWLAISSCISSSSSVVATGFLGPAVLIFLDTVLLPTTVPYGNGLILAADKLESYIASTEKEDTARKVIEKVINKY